MKKKKKELVDKQCQKCGRMLVESWTVPDYVLREVIGKDEKKLLCMSCFSQIAEEKGMTISWFGVREYDGKI